ncbi:hypothetical protein CXB51_024089 [Gossypium anomalum]|uniref:DUF7745 domain-containing protein n=1 Tax=Gossypium anomalum TaxID=47600 RepID=A0A8J6CWS5_9ROSI|nr:hypothetical protein CXB51_024089 [Gossypium anomalum]
MRNEYLNKVEDNASICTWSEKTQLEKGDSVTEGYTSELWDFTRTYGDLSYLLDIKVDKHLFRAMVQFWNPAYSCFTCEEVEVVPTLEEYTTLLRCLRIQGNKAYVRPASLPIFVRKLVMITGMNVKKKVNVLALSIYGLVIFLKAIGHIDEAVANLFDRIGLFPLKGSSNYTKERRYYRRKVDGYSSESLRGEVLWKAPWMTPNEVLYHCSSFDWVPLPGIWGVVGYAPLLVLRQYKAGQFR